MSDKKNIKEMFGAILNDIANLENEKNLNNIVTQYNNILNEIKNSANEICDLQNKLKSIDNDAETNQKKEKKEISEEQYDMYMKELFDNNIINCDVLEEQIDDYKKMIKNINKCKKYLESKKMTIVEYAL